jgi:hypothetical protein
MISAMSSPHNRTGHARIMAIAEALRLLSNGFYGVSANHIGRLFPLIMAAHHGRSSIMAARRELRPGACSGLGEDIIAARSKAAGPMVRARRFRRLPTCFYSVK